jgi:thymidylate synthase
LEIYNKLLKEISTTGVREINKRTGQYLLIITTPKHLIFDLSNRSIPVPNNRRYFPTIGVVEAEWQWLGTKDPTLIMEHYPKVWGDFIEDGEIKAAYGYRWRHAFGRDQIALAIKALKEDPSNRQICISAWHPGEDGLGVLPQPKNIPCPAFFHLYIVQNVINMSVFIRSSDVFIGLPYDIMTYSVLLEKFRQEINPGLTLGVLSVTTSHTHLYEKHIPMIAPGEGSYVFPIDLTISGAKEHMKNTYAIHPYNPKPELFL